MQTSVAKGIKVPCIIMITEVSIRCQKNSEVGIRRISAYTPPPIHHCLGAYLFRFHSSHPKCPRSLFLTPKIQLSFVRLYRERLMDMRKLDQFLFDSSLCCFISLSSRCGLVAICRTQPRNKLTLG